MARLISNQECRLHANALHKLRQGPLRLLNAGNLENLKALEAM
jgi:hypothetical protein